MTLDALRARIDRIDEKLLRLLNRRASMALQIGRLKKKHGLPVFDEKRERAVIARLVRGNGGPLPAASVKGIFREILRRNRGLQGK